MFYSAAIPIPCTCTISREQKRPAFAWEWVNCSRLGHCLGACRKWNVKFNTIIKYRVIKTDIWWLHNFLHTGGLVRHNCEYFNWSVKKSISFVFFYFFEKIRLGGFCYNYNPTNLDQCVTFFKPKLLQLKTRNYGHTERYSLGSKNLYTYE